MKYTLAESHSISNDVKCMTIDIIDKMKQKMINIKPHYIISRDIKAKWGYFKYNSTIGGQKFSFNVKYKVYWFENEEQKKQKYKQMMDLGGECDFEKKFIRICTYMINGIIPYSFYSDFQHELSHMYQNYMGGGKKNETYYQAVTRLAQSRYMLEKCVGNILYRCFPHEQDAMANEFYAYLVQNYKNKVLDDFDKALEYLQYANFEIAYNKLAEMTSNTEYYNKFIQLLKNELGMTADRFEKTVNSGEDRFLRKLENAHIAYLEDVNKVLYETLNPQKGEFYKMIGLDINNCNKFIFS